MKFPEVGCGIMFGNASLDTTTGYWFTEQVLLIGEI